MADKQYDVSHKIRRLFEEKQKIRQALHQEVQAKEYSPFRKMTQLIDPAVVRYHAMLTYRPEYMYATPKNTSLFCFCFIVPLMVSYYAFTYETSSKEKLIRSGQIKYEDRVHFTLY